VPERAPFHTEGGGTGKAKGRAVSFIKKEILSGHKNKKEKKKKP